MNISIHLKRMAFVAKWTLWGERQRLLTWGVAMTAIYAAVICLFLWAGKDEEPQGRELAMYMAQGLCTSAYCFGSLFFMTRVFANLKHKGGAIAFLSLPASQLEKWLVRVLYATLLLQLLATVTLLVADGLGFLFSLFLGLDYPASVAQGVMQEVMRGFRYSTTVDGVTFHSPWIFGVALNFFSSALVIWASTVFRHPLLSSIGAMAALVVVLIAPGLRATQGLLQQVGTGWLSFLFCLAAAVMVSVACWLLRLSYRTFTRREIVTQKWMNL